MLVIFAALQIQKRIEAMTIYVNNEEIAQDMLEQELQMLVERYRTELAPDEMQRREEQIRDDARENAIERMILIQQARREIEDPDPEEVQEQFDHLLEQHGGAEGFERQFRKDPGARDRIKSRIADGIRLEQYFDQICAEMDSPGEDECRAYYEQNQEQYQFPEMLRASHIVRSPEEGQRPEQLIAEMMNMREELIKGAPFADMADSRSQCDDNGGDLGWFPRGQMVPEFEEVVFKMQPGEISDVFQTPFGFHIVKLAERRPGGLREFDDVRYEIENLLFDQKKNERIGEVVDELKKDSTIVIEDEKGDQ